MIGNTALVQRIIVLRVIDDNNVAAFFDSNRALRLGGGDWVPGREDLVELFQCPALGFNSEEVPQERLNTIPTNKDEDVVVLDVSEGNWASERVDERDDIDNRLVSSHSFGTGVGLQTFDWVQCLQRRVCERVDKVEEEVSSKSALSEADVAQVTGQFDLESSVDGQHDSTDKGTDPKDLTPWHFISECNTSVCTGSRDEGDGQVENELHGGVITQEFEDLGVEVAKTVARELTKDAHKDDHQASPSGVVTDEQAGVVVPALVSSVKVNTFPELLPLEGNPWGVGIIGTVVLDQEIASFLLTTAQEEPARRFRQ
jgi:hypothetical protein